MKKTPIQSQALNRKHLPRHRPGRIAHWHVADAALDTLTETKRRKTTTVGQRERSGGPDQPAATATTSVVMTALGGRQL